LTGIYRIQLLRDWQISPSRQPKPDAYDYDLDRALRSVVALRTVIPEDAFTAETLGTERGGNGVVIGDDLVLTIGYIITEAEEVWIGLGDGSVIAGHPLGYDQATGFGLVRALGRLGLPALPLGESGNTPLRSRVVVAAGGGLHHALAAWIVSKQEFAGYWEYVLDEAIFTAPAHPLWGGAAVIGPSGDLLGIGSLQVEHRNEAGETGTLNMSVPIDLLKPILHDLVTSGRADRPARAWLGVFATELDENVVVVGVYNRGPAESAGLKAGDVILTVGGERVANLASFFRRVWQLGPAGAEIPLTISRHGEEMRLRVIARDRDTYLRRPKMHS
jgi:S1-C subfamily serine protease